MCIGLCFGIQAIIDIVVQDHRLDRIDSVESCLAFHVDFIFYIHETILPRGFYKNIDFYGKIILFTYV